MTRQAVARKARYRADPEWRAMICRKSKACRDRHKDNPLYRKLENVRKSVYRVRESYNARVAHAERLFAQLETLVAERDRLAAEWKASSRKER